MLAAIRYHVRNLANPRGRDARQTYWFWFLFVFLLNVAASLVMTVPMLVSVIASGLEVARSGDQAAAESLMLGEMSGNVRQMMAMSAVLGCMNLALMATALVRRLHDSGNTGLWALVAGAIYLASLALGWSRADDAATLMRELAATSDPSQAIAVQTRMAWDALIGYVPLIMVVVFGLLRSEPGPNRYGEEPLRP